MNTSPSTKTCTVCGQKKPLDQFRRRRATGEVRESRCRSCYNASMRAYRRMQRAAAIRSFAADLASAPSLSRATALCDSMLRRFGGPERFGALWASEIQAALSKQPGLSRAIKAMLAIAKLQALVQANSVAN